MTMKITMKKSILILIFALTTSLSFGQKEHLEPAKDFKQYKGDLKKYYDSVFLLLYKGFSEKPIARYTSMPSFSNEYSFSVETINGKQFIVSNRFSQNYWYTENKNEVKLITNKIELHKDLYLKIRELFKLLDEQTKKSENNLMGLDGVTYYFSTTDENNNLKTGEIWSPSEKTLLHRLVKICDNLYSIGNGKSISQEGILEEIDKLINHLKQ